MWPSVAHLKSKPSGRTLNLEQAVANLNLPLHAKIRQLLRERALHDFAHNQQFYSERDLIDKLGVSQPTVRRALSDLVGEGYLVADARRGYFVHHHGETRCVGLMQLVDERRAYGPETLECMSVCRDREMTFSLYGVHKRDTAADVMGTIRRKPSEERIILTHLTLELTHQLDSLLQAAGYRHVFVGPRPPGFAGSSVYRDQDQEVALVLDYLVELGHRRIVFMINEPEELVITNRRAQIVKRELQKRGLDQAQLVNCQTQVWQSSFDSAYRKTHEILQSKPWPTAIVPLSGVGSWATMRYAVQHGISIPGQISVLSFDPMINTDLLPVPITELTLSEHDCAQKAVDLLWQDNPEPVHENIDTTLVIRESSAPPPKGG